MEVLTGSSNQPNVGVNILHISNRKHPMSHSYYRVDCELSAEACDRLRHHDDLSLSAGTKDAYSDFSYTHNYRITISSGSDIVAASHKQCKPTCT